MKSIRQSRTDTNAIRMFRVLFVFLSISRLPLPCHVPPLPRFHSPDTFFNSLNCYCFKRLIAHGGARKLIQDHYECYTPSNTFSWRQHFFRALHIRWILLQLFSVLDHIALRDWYSRRSEGLDSISLWELYSAQHTQLTWTLISRVLSMQKVSYSDWTMRKAREAYEVPWRSLEFPPA